MQMQMQIQQVSD